MYVIGLDGGGTYIRTVLADESGNILYRKKFNNGASPIKNFNAKRDVQNAIKETIEGFGIGVGDIDGVAMGVADFNSEDDLGWIEKYSDIEGMNCPFYYYNDTEVAGKGAFGDGNGIIVVAGTGSSVTGFTDSGEIVNNRSDFGHDARAGAVKMSIDMLERLVIEYEEVEMDFIEKVLNELGLGSLEELERRLVSVREEGDPDFLSDVGKLGSLVTEEAENGNKLAEYVCENAMKELAIGVEKVSESFNSEEIKVVIVGGVVNDDYMFDIFMKNVKGLDKDVIVGEAINTPEEGAVFLALDKLNEK